MRIIAAIVFVVALGIGGTTFWYLQDYFSQQEAETAADLAKARREVVRVPAFEVVVAARNLPAGKILEDKDLMWQEWPEVSLDASYSFHAEDDDSSKDPKLNKFLDTPHVVKRGIEIGEPVTLNRVFRQGGAGFLAGMLSPGMRATTIPITALSAAAGFILPGDRVDIMLIRQSTGGAAKTTIETILENARVLAIDQAISTAVEGQEGAAPTRMGSSATFEVSSADAQMLEIAKTMGRFSLSLRSLSRGPGDEQRPPFTTDVEVLRLLRSGIPSAGADAATEGAAAPAPAIPSVLVLGAIRDLPSGTLLRDSDLGWVESPEGLSLESYFAEGRDTRQPLRGALLTQPLAAGEPLDSGTLVKPDEPGFLAAAVPPGRRAINVAATGAAGIIPGDRVDIMRATLASEKTGKPALEIILPKVRVLRYTPQGVTVAVTPENLEQLVLAGATGALSLALRSRAELAVAKSARSVTPAPKVVKKKVKKKRPERKTAALAGAWLLVAARDLPAGTLLKDSDLRFKFFPGAAPSQSFFARGTVKIEALRGAALQSAVAAGRPIRVDDVIGPEEPGFLAASMTPGKRAVSIALTNETAVSGLVSPGDQVDVVLSIQVDERRFGEIILERVRVLTFDTESNQAILEVTPKESETLVVAREMGPLSLALRSQAEAPGDEYAGPFTSDLEVSRALGGVPEEAVEAPTATGTAVATPAKAPKSAKRATAVKVYRGATPSTLVLPQ